MNQRHCEEAYQGRRSNLLRGRRPKQEIATAAYGGLAMTRLTFLLATRNRHKARELRRLLRGSSIRLVTLDRFPSIPPVREDGATFRANAVKKAARVSRRTILPVLAEDSGLEVRALGGQPGVRSARFAGPAQKDGANVAKLLRALARAPSSRRQARFVCVMAVALGGKVVRTLRGTCAGFIADRPRGRGGFGYDPVFIPRGKRRTMAQMPAADKDRLSHRGEAARKLRGWLLSSPRMRGSRSSMKDFEDDCVDSRWSLPPTPIGGGNDGPI